MLNRTRVPAMFGALLALAWLILPSAALAHERRDVGNYEFVVGWQGEPAFTNEKNGISLQVTQKPQAGQQDAKPVEGLEKTLKAEVIFGGQRREVELRAVFNQPGRYAADLMPTREGDYRFRFFGTIEGTQVNETFDSADGKFNVVQPIGSIQFPEAAAAAAPQNSQAVQAAQRAANEAQAAASTNQLLSIAALVLGGLGLVLGALALAASRRAAAASGHPRRGEPLRQGSRL